MARSFCLFCSKEFKYKKGSCAGKYCSNICQQKFQMKLSIKNWLNGGKKPGKTTLKNYLNETHGQKCSCCHLSKWLNKDITLEIDHSDGNPYNDSPENLRYLCPNCHSQTESYKAKNKGNGRIERRVKANENYQREKEAKSLNKPL